MNCCICDSEEKNYFEGFSRIPRVTSDAKPFKEGGNLTYCSRCGVVQKVLDSHFKDELADIYRSYTPYHQSNNNTQIIFEKSGPVSRCKVLLDHIKNYLNVNNVKTVLDFGCGVGSFLSEINAAHPHIELYAFDLDNKNESSIKNLSSFKNFFTGDYRNINKKFSLITFIHSLEHMPDPVEVLSYIRNNLLEENGFLMIQVPNVEENSFDLLVADHISHFTPHSLEQLIKRAGFKKVNKTYDWVGNQLSFLLCTNKIGYEDITSDVDLYNHIKCEVDKFHHIVDFSSHLSQNTHFGIFGTSISSTWLAGVLKERVHFFVDEDINRIGNIHLGKPILSPVEVGKNSVVYAPFPPSLVDKIKKKHFDYKWEFSLFSPN